MVDFLGSFIAEEISAICIVAMAGYDPSMGTKVNDVVVRRKGCAVILMITPVQRITSEVRKPRLLLTCANSPSELRRSVNRLLIQA